MDIPVASLPIDSFESPTILAEQKILVFANFPVDNILDELLAKHSSFTNVQRQLSYILRFIHNVRTTEPHLGPLSKQELYDSFLILV